MCNSVTFVTFGKEIWPRKVGAKFFLHFFQKKFGKSGMFDVYLHRDSKTGRARDSNVKGANEVRTARSALGPHRMSLAH